MRIPSRPSPPLLLQRLAEPGRDQEVLLAQVYDQLLQASPPSPRPPASASDATRTSASATLPLPSESRS